MLSTSNLLPLRYHCPTPLLLEAPTNQRWPLPKLFFDLNLSKQGLVSGRQLEKFLWEMIPVSTFDELKLPFAAVATDYESRTGMDYLPLSRIPMNVRSAPQW